MMDVVKGLDRCEKTTMCLILTCFPLRLKGEQGQKHVTGAQCIYQGKLTTQETAKPAKTMYTVHPNCSMIRPYTNPIPCNNYTNILKSNFK